MATCKDCVHAEVCEEYGEVFSLIKSGKCSLFKDRSRFVELPIKPGEKIYHFEALSKRTKKKENEFYRGHCVSDDGKFCKHIKAAKGDNLSNENTMSCEYGEVNCPYAKPLEEVSTK